MDYDYDMNMDDYDYDWNMDYDYDNEWDMDYEGDMNMDDYDYDMNMDDYDYDMNMDDYDYMMGDDYDYDMTHDDYEGDHSGMQDGFYWANCGQLDAQLDACTARAEIVDGEVASCTVMASAMGFTFSDNCEAFVAEAGLDWEDIVHTLEWNYDGATDYMAGDYDYDYNMGGDVNTNDYEDDEDVWVDGFYWANCGQLDE